MTIVNYHTPLRTELPASSFQLAYLMVRTIFILDNIVCESPFNFYKTCICLAYSPDCKNALKRNIDNELIEPFKGKGNPLTSYTKTVPKVDNKWEIKEAIIYL